MMDTTLLGFIASDPYVQATFLLCISVATIALAIRRWLFAEARDSHKENFAANRASAKELFEAHRAKGREDFALAKLNSETMLQKHSIDVQANPKLIGHEDNNGG